MQEPVPSPVTPPAVSASVADTNKVGASTPRPGRNDPCPCGAVDQQGKRVKWKNCHLKVLNQRITTAQRAIQATQEHRRKQMELEDILRIGDGLMVVHEVSKVT